MNTTASQHWVHNWDPFIFQFPDGFFIEGIRWYGFAYVLGFLSAIILLKIYFYKGRSPLNAEKQTDLITAIILGTLIGGRLGYMLLYDFENFIQNPLSVIEVWHGGMASHGGFVGVFLAICWFSKKNKIDFWQVSDIVVTLAPLGLFFGRIANFINAELIGKASQVPWAIIFPIKNHLGEVISYTPPCHPSQLYQALLEGLALFLYTQMRFWLSDNKSRIKGLIVAEFLISYAILRMIAEAFREPDASLIWGLSRGSFYSLFLIVVGAAIFVLRLKTKKEIKKP